MWYCRVCTYVQVCKHVREYVSVGVHVFMCVPCTCMPTCERLCVSVQVCTCTCVCPCTCVHTFLGYVCVLGLQWVDVSQALPGISQVHVPVFLGTCVYRSVVHQWVNRVIKGSVSSRLLPTLLRYSPVGTHMCECEHPRVYAHVWCVSVCVGMCLVHV